MMLRLTLYPHVIDDSTKTLVAGGPVHEEYYPIQLAELQRWARSVVIRQEDKWDSAVIESYDPSDPSHVVYKEVHYSPRRAV